MLTQAILFSGIYTTLGNLFMISKKKRKFCATYEAEFPANLYGKGVKRDFTYLIEECHKFKAFRNQSSLYVEVIYWFRESGKGAYITNTDFETLLENLQRSRMVGNSKWRPWRRGCRFPFWSSIAVY